LRYVFRMTAQDSLKREAAARALEFVTSGMKLGLGTGSTAEAFLELLAPRVRGGVSVDCVATSERTAQLARTLGVPLGDLDALAPLDLTIDGADEADRDLNLIKGGGAALLREKIVAASSKAMVVIADESKLVARLGKFPLPVEVVAFGHGATAARIRSTVSALGYADAPVRQRMKDGAAVKTDSGNLIYDCAFGAINDAKALAAALSAVPGVVEHGLFVGIATTLVVAHPGEVEIIPANR
jgi:ribose 5-phosphate isomerase A